jgi:putative ABC transport system permease protein
MSPLHIKLLRDLRRLWAQALAIALVMAAGVATLIIAVGAHDALQQTRANYYENNRFADIVANVTRAPKALLPEIASLDGVAAVEPRIVKIALTSVDGMAEPASTELVSLPDIGEQALNVLYLRTGRLPDPGSPTDVVISEGFATAHHFTAGSSFLVLLNGAQRQVRVTGIALSPEFIYTLGPGDLLPDPRRFGIVWMSEKSLAAAYNLDGRSPTSRSSSCRARPRRASSTRSTGCWHPMAGRAPMAARTRPPTPSSIPNCCSCGR